MEKIVRPFQTRDISPPKSVAGPGAPAEGTVGANAVKLTWGKRWQLKVMNGSINIDETFYSVRKVRERPLA